MPQEARLQLQPVAGTALQGVKGNHGCVFTTAQDRKMPSCFILFVTSIASCSPRSANPVRRA